MAGNPADRAVASRVPSQVMAGASSCTLMIARRFLVPGSQMRTVLSSPAVARRVWLWRKAHTSWTQLVWPSRRACAWGRFCGGVRKCLRTARHPRVLRRHFSIEAKERSTCPASSTPPSPRCAISAHASLIGPAYAATPSWATRSGPSFCSPRMRRIAIADVAARPPASRRGLRTARSGPGRGG